MKKILYLLLLLIIVSCGSSKKINDIMFGNGNYMLIQYDTLINYTDFGYFCSEEKIPVNFNLWIKSDFIDYEEGKLIREYFYIYRGEEDEIIYNVVFRNDDIQIRKRITTDKLDNYGF